MKTYKNSARTEKWIRKAFAELIAEKKSLDKITISEIIQKADITKPTFYYHYSDLDDLVKSIENEMIEELTKTFDEAETSNDVPIEYYVTVLSDFLKKNEEEYKSLANAVDLNYFLEKLKRIFIRKVNNPVFGLSNDSTIRSIQATFISCAIVDTLLEYFKGNIPGELKDVESTILMTINKLQS